MSFVHPSVRLSPLSLSPIKFSPPLPKKPEQQCIKRSSGDGGGVGGELHTQIQKGGSHFAPSPKWPTFLRGFYFYYFSETSKNFGNRFDSFPSKGLICPCVILEKKWRAPPKKGLEGRVCLEVFEKLIRPDEIEIHDRINDIRRVGGKHFELVG
jgi:hypothetical protein